MEAKSLIGILPEGSEKNLRGPLLEEVFSKNYVFKPKTAFFEKRKSSLLLHLLFLDERVCSLKKVFAECILSKNSLQSTLNVSRSYDIPSAPS